MRWNNEGLRNLDKSLGKGHNLRERNYLMENCGRVTVVSQPYLKGCHVKGGLELSWVIAETTTSSYKTKAKLNNKKSKTCTEHQLYSSE